MNLGSGSNGQFTFLDVVSLISFYIGIANLNENLSQNDKQDMLANLHNSAQSVLSEIHNHLKSQDEKLDLILSKLEENNDSRRNLQ